MDEQIKNLTEKVEKLQATLDWMITRMWRAQSLHPTQADLDAAGYVPPKTVEGSFIGGGTFNTIVPPSINTASHTDLN